MSEPFDAYHPELGAAYRPNESEIPAPLEPVGIIVPDPASVLEALPRCEASAGAHRCARTAGYDVSGVKLCAQHNAVRGQGQRLSLADGRAINHAGVVGQPAPPTEPAACVVDALLGYAAGVTADATRELVGLPVDLSWDDPTARSLADLVLTLDAESVVAAIDRVLPPTSIPPSEAEPEPRACIPPPREPVPVPPFMSTDSATRKGMPVATGFVEYFPDAMLIASMVSIVGAVKHCGGKLGWDKSKSADEPDAELRHMIDRFRGDPADPGLEALAHLGHYASKLWRAAADAQRACDAVRAAFNRGEDWRK